MKEFRQVTIEPFVTSCFLAVIGMVTTLAFLFFNIYQRNSRIIKMSSPRMNAITSVGGLLMNVACFLYGVDSFFMGRYDQATTICQTRTWLICCGFTLVFGPMLVKAWRVERIFNCSGVQRVVITDQKLLVVVSLLVLGDVALLALWQMLDPMQCTIVRYSKEILYRDINNQTANPDVLMQKCVSTHRTVWVTVICLWKAAMMVYGLNLSWRIRNVSVPVMNDALCLTVSIFSAMSLTSLAVGFTVLFGDWPNAVCIIIAVVIFIETLVAQTMVFAPKIYLWWKMSPESSFRISGASHNHSSSYSRSAHAVEEDILNIFVDNRNLKRCLAEKNTVIAELENLLTNAQEKLLHLPVEMVSKQDSGVDSDVSSYCIQCETERDNKDSGMDGNSDVFLNKSITRKESTHSRTSTGTTTKRKNSTNSQGSKRSSKRRSSWKSDLASNSSKLSLLRESLAEDLAHAHILTSSIKTSLVEDADITFHQMTLVIDTMREQEDLARRIAESYEIINDPDTYSYVSGLVSLRGAGSPTRSLQSPSSTNYSTSPGVVSSSASVCGLDNDKLYPVEPMSLNFMSGLCSPVKQSEIKSETARVHTFV
ncbi:hypothetical protein ScPMuIL_010401 [Solemya velum]